MKSASVPRPLAEIILRTMHEDTGIHHEGWTQRIIAGWYIVRQSAHYRLLHGRQSLGNVEEVDIEHSLIPRHAYLHILLASGMEVYYPIREPRRPEQ